jgi:hypothetical protein
MEMLRGASQTLLTCRPAVQSGIHPQVLLRSGGSMADVWDILQTHGMVVLYQNRRIDKSWSCRQEGLVDVQALPRERL